MSSPQSATAPLPTRPRSCTSWLTSSSAATVVAEHHGFTVEEAHAVEDRVRHRGASGVVPEAVGGPDLWATRERRRGRTRSHRGRRRPGRAGTVGWSASPAERADGPARRSSQPDRPRSPSPRPDQRQRHGVRVQQCFGVVLAEDGRVEHQGGLSTHGARARPMASPPRRPCRRRAAGCRRGRHCAPAQHRLSPRAVAAEGGQFGQPLGRPSRSRSFGTSAACVPAVKSPATASTRRQVRQR